MIGQLFSIAWKALFLYDAVSERVKAAQKPPAAAPAAIQPPARQRRIMTKRPPNWTADDEAERRH